MTESEKQYNTALLGGGFKPPHKGHIELLKALLSKAEKVIILTSNLSSKNRTFKTGTLAGRLIDGEVCNRLLSEMIDAVGLDGVEVVISRKPVGDIFEYVGEKAVPGEKILLGVGNKDVDVKRFANIQKYVPQEKNIQVSVEVLEPVLLDGESLSASRMREAISNADIEQVANFLPDEISNKVQFAEKTVQLFMQQADIEEQIYESIISNLIEEEVLSEISAMGMGAVSGAVVAPSNKKKTLKFKLK